MRSSDPHHELVTLVPLSDRQLTEWLPGSLDEYAVSLRGIGRAEVDVHLAVEAVRTLFTEGPPPGDLLWSIRAEGMHVGVLWLTPGERDDEADWWINDLSVLVPYRRRGYARAALRAAMLEAACRGADHIGLSVFADNAAARRLYAAAGFQETQIDMSIRLPRADRAADSLPKNP